MREEDDAQVMSTTNFSTVIQFGDESTLEYLKGAQKISVRYTAGGSIATETFSGGKSLNDVIGKALKACGKVSTDTSKMPIPRKSPRHFEMISPGIPE